MQVYQEKKSQLYPTILPGYPKYLYGLTFRLSPKVFDAKLLNYEAFCNVFSIFRPFPQGVRHSEHEGYFYFFELKIRRIINTLSHT